MSKENVTFILGEDKIEMPVYFTRFSKVKKEIFLELFFLKYYKVNSKCRREIFDQYIEFWRTGDPPTIDIQNCWEFYQLGEEFEITLEISSKYENKLRISKLLSIGSQYEASDLSTVEQSICDDINIFLDLHPDDFFSIPVTRLYNIFNKGLDKINDKNQAYKLICQYAKNKNKDLYVLLNVFNTNDLSESAILDMAFNIKNHEYFTPQITKNALEILINQKDIISKTDYVSINFNLKQDVKDNKRIYERQIQNLKNENMAYKNEIDELKKEIENLRKQVVILSKPSKKKLKPKSQVKFAKSQKLIQKNLVDDDTVKYAKSQNNINADESDID